MTTILDFLQWRGDLSFKQEPIGNADRLLFCILSYLPFENIIPEDFKNQSITLSNALHHVEVVTTAKDGKSTLTTNQLQFIKGMKNCPRYADIPVTGFVNKHDSENQSQFSAITFLLPDQTILIVYRGTDGTVLGWKEDLDFSFERTTPAQQYAAEYMRKVLDYFNKSIRIAGHSKGGNLAVYAAMECPLLLADRIIEVNNMDGPGFNKKTIETFHNREINLKVHTYVPQFDVVGQLLYHEENYTIVKSDDKGIMQHDPFSWGIMRSNFITAKDLSKDAVILDKTLKDFIYSMSFAQREEVVNGLYDLIKACHAKTLKELWSPYNAMIIMKELLKMNQTNRNFVEKTLHLLEKAFEEVI